jgi:hypothetical protein
MPEDDCAIINGHKKPGELAVVVLTPVEHLFDRCVQQQTTGTSLEKKLKFSGEPCRGFCSVRKLGRMHLLKPPRHLGAHMAWVGL